MPLLLLLAHTVETSRSDVSIVGGRSLAALRTYWARVHDFQDVFAKPGTITHRHRLYADLTHVATHTHTLQARRRLTSDGGVDCKPTTSCRAFVRL